jgi:hypothetical protein
MNWLFPCGFFFFMIFFIVLASGGWIWWLWWPFGGVFFVFALLAFAFQGPYKQVTYNADGSKTVVYSATSDRESNSEVVMQARLNRLM